MAGDGISVSEERLPTVTVRQCRTALVRSGIAGSGYCLNPYGGCTHRCVYCYAGFMLRFLHAEGSWGSFVQVKENFPERLAAELRRIRPSNVLVSSVCDPYQPVEEERRITRSVLELLAAARVPVTILTKSDLVTRDADIIREIPGSEVGFSFSTADDRSAGWLEPGAPSPLRRFEAIASLAKAGIPTWVFIAPVIPGIGDNEGALREILARARKAGALRAGYDPLSCYPAAVSGLRRVFSEHCPDRLPVLLEACRDEAAFRARVREIAGGIWLEYGYQL
jgi:DNA repair photolyase